MANFYRSEVVTAMREQALVPVFYHASKDVVLEIIGACARGGSRLVEFTNRGEGAADLFGELIKVCRKEFPKLMVGVGSIRDEITAGIYLGKGADFVVGPTFNPRVAEICNRLAVPYSPGCGTASEINNAEAAGSEIIKIFPGGEVGGPAFFKAIHGPAARTQMMPTGGVETTAESIHGWLTVGQAAALGIGSELVKKDLVAKKDWAAIENSVRRTLHVIRAVRNRALASEGVIFKGVHHVGVPAADMNASVKMLGDLAGFGLTKPPGSTMFIAGAGGAAMEVGPGDKVKEHGHVALEVTDIDKALELLAKNGIKVDGEVRVSSDKTVKAAYLAEGAFGLGMRVHLYCLFSEEVEAAMTNAQ
jgi:2-dehydro-3-deoxyphosphogluconate aldolase/(4S)-4-hydroxy-2-oxoglutarate aldolase